MAGVCFWRSWPSGHGRYGGAREEIGLYRPAIRLSFPDVHIRRPQLGQKQFPAAENVQRQIAVAFVIAVEEPAFLAAMDGIIGRVEIEDDALGRRCAALEKDADEQPFRRALVHAELAIAVVVCLWCVFKPVQRGLSRQHSAIGAARFRLARDKAQHGIMAQPIMIVEVFKAKRDAMNALGEQRFDRVLDAVLPAAICEAGRDLLGQAEDAVASRNKSAPAFEVMPRRQKPL